jgi:hypothetical protein
MPYTDFLKSDQCPFLHRQFGFDIHIRGFKHIGAGSDGRNWPLPVIRPFQKANLNTGHSDF